MSLTEFSAAVMKSYSGPDRLLANEAWILSDSFCNTLKEVGLQPLTEYFGTETSRLELASEFLSEMAELDYLSTTLVWHSLMDWYLCNKIHPFERLDSGVFSLVPLHIGEPPEEDEDTDSAAHAIHIFSKLLCQRHMEKQLEKESVVVTVEAGFIAHLYGRLDF